MSAHFLNILRSGAVSSHMLNYVKGLLAPVDSMSKNGQTLPFRSRFSHTEHVIEWALRICGPEGGDAGIVSVAGIFHDSGYSVKGDGHALYSANVFDAYMSRFEPDRFPADDIGDILITNVRSTLSSSISINKVRDVISRHSDKHLSCSELSLESRILMDADRLDEIGAMGVLFDCFVAAQSPAYNYNDAYDRICATFEKDGELDGRLYTESGAKHYMKMRRYIAGFISGLKEELGR